MTKLLSVRFVDSNGDNSELIINMNAMDLVRITPKEIVICALNKEKYTTKARNAIYEVL